MRVLSPRIEPPVRTEEGSTASTATRLPRSVRNVPSASMVVDLPTPGAPVIPTRIALPVKGNKTRNNSCASARCAGFFDSTSVIARASAARSPARIFLATMASGLFIFGNRRAAEALSTPLRARGKAAQDLFVLVGFRALARKNLLCVVGEIGLK